MNKYNTKLVISQDKKIAQIITFKYTIFNICVLK